MLLHCSPVASSAVATSSPVASSAVATSSLVASSAVAASSPIASSAVAASTSTTSNSALINISLGPAPVASSTVSSAAAVSSPAGATVVPQVNSVYNVVGCYVDSNSQRALQSPGFQGNVSSVEACATYCASYRYNFFGVEGGKICKMFN